MGGRGTYAAGNMVEFHYKTVGYVYDVPILEGLNGEHSLPECAYSSWTYIRLDRGIFREMKIYDEDGVLCLQIDYHGEYPLTGKRNKKVLHYHTYTPEFSLTKNGDFIRSKGKLLTEEMKKSYSKYFKGVEDI